MDVVVWLRSLGLEEYEEAFRDNKIDERVLPNLTQEDLKEIGVGPVAANARVVGGDALALIGDGGYDRGTRAARIQSDLAARGDKQTPYDIRHLPGRRVDYPWVFLGCDPASEADRRIGRKARHRGVTRPPSRDLPGNGPAYVPLGVTDDEILRRYASTTGD